MSFTQNASRKMSQHGNTLWNIWTWLLTWPRVETRLHKKSLLKISVFSFWQVYSKVNNFMKPKFQSWEFCITCMPKVKIFIQFRDKRKSLILTFWIEICNHQSYRLHRSPSLGILHLTEFWKDCSKKLAHVSQSIQVLSILNTTKQFSNCLTSFGRH